MCVIIVKKKGIELPSKDFLRSAARENPDGCGFATSSGEYFRSVNFERFWSEFSKRAKVEDDIVIHFRWATHGSVKMRNCHPFKGEVDGKALFFAHNGVLPIESKNDMTDSEIYFRETALPYLTIEHGFTDLTDEVFEEDCMGSKFAFVSEEGLHLFGHWEQYKGLLLSNRRFLHTYEFLNRGGRMRSFYGESKYAGVGF